MPLLVRLALAAMLTVSVVGVAPASATSVAPMTLDQMTDASDLVVRGTVESVWVEEDAKGVIWTRALVRVDEGMKGNADPGDYVTVEAAGGTIGTKASIVAGSARYSVGEETLLFLSDKPSKGVYGTIGMGVGKFTVRPSPIDGTPLLVRFMLSQDKAYDARFLPVPPIDQQVTLASVETSVRARAALGWDGKSIPGISDAQLRTINRLQPGVR
ncbi:MAG: hypothetical protein Q8P18_19120 [Pseudomonadota bacterium]|nr:hypothetical protein [Pseudomonadota bacterium]